MRLIATAILAATLTMSGCAATPPEPERIRIASEAEFTQLLGQRLTLDQGFVVFGSDKTISGNIGGVPLAGTWTFDDGYWCRTLTEGPDNAIAVPYDCQVVELAGNRLYGTRDRGAGETYSYQIEQ